MAVPAGASFPFSAAPSATWHTTVPLLLALEGAPDPWIAFWPIAAALTISSLYSSISAVVKAELFPVEIRAGCGPALRNCRFAIRRHRGLRRVVVQVHRHESGFYWYVTACVLCSLVVYVTMRETKDT
jgi:MHS family alpha-ketoglutarate permease-like MFS transporter